MANDHVIDNIEYLINAYGGIPAVDKAGTIAVYRDALVNTDADILSEAIRRAVKECKFFPRVSELMAIYRRVEDEHAKTPQPSKRKTARGLMNEYQALKDRTYGGDDVTPEEFEDLAKRYDAIEYECMAADVRQFAELAKVEI